MTPKELKAIKQRVRSVSRDWTWARCLTDPDYVSQGSHLGDTLVCLDDVYEGAQEHCAFIEHAPSDIRALLAEVARLKKINKALLNNV